MRGINRPWSAVHDTVIAEVKALIAKYPTYTLEATGHSLGGALTYISHVALAQNFPGKALTSTALAAFPIGNSAWATFAGSQSGKLKRGNNALDGVPVSPDYKQKSLDSTNQLIEHVRERTIQLPALRNRGSYHQACIQRFSNSMTGILQLWIVTEHFQMFRSARPSLLGGQSHVRCYRRTFPELWHYYGSRWLQISHHLYMDRLVCRCLHCVTSTVKR